jgi:hypothetical protein
MEVLFKRDYNLMIKHRSIEVYLNDEFIDYINPKDVDKIIKIEERGRLYLRVNNSSSNVINLNKINETDFLKLSFTSQIQNGLFVFIALTFFGSLLLGFFDIISVYFRMALMLPFAIIVYWQTLGKKNYLRLTIEN